MAAVGLRMDYLLGSHLTLCAIGLIMFHYFCKCIFMEVQCSVLGSNICQLALQDLSCARQKKEIKIQRDSFPQKTKRLATCATMNADMVAYNSKPGTFKENGVSGQCVG